MKLTDVHIRGFQSIDNVEGQNISLGDVTILLGANGSGKSNLVTFFRLLNALATDTLKSFVGKYGCNSLLYYGMKHTEEIHVDLYVDKNSDYKHTVIFSPAHDDTLFPLKMDTKNSNSKTKISTINQYKDNIGNLLRQIKVYQFHDTSDTASIKDRQYIDDAGHLKSDAANLAAYLRMLKKNPEYTKFYNKIVRHIRHIMPQFGDFKLGTVQNSDYTRLNWTDASGNDYLFNPNQLSDGTLRFIALATLLFQPSELMPGFIVIDEPELGLHPSAIVELAAMIRSASQHAQVLVATQSPRLLDEFKPEQVVIAERDPERNCSTFKRLPEDELKDWLERYNMSELWEKNVLGGRP